MDNDKIKSIANSFFDDPEVARVEGAALTAEPTKSLLTQTQKKAAKQIIKDKRYLARKEKKLQQIADDQADFKQSHKFMMTPILRKTLFDNRADAMAIVNQLIAQGKKGNLNAINEIWNRLDGKPTEHHEIDEHRTIILNFVPAEQLLAEQTRVNIVEGTALQITSGEDNDEHR